MEPKQEEIPLRLSPRQQFGGVNSNLPAYHLTQSEKSYSATESTAFSLPAAEVPVLLVGGCPVCRIGVLHNNFAWPGILLAVLLFPVGILCCVLMRQRRCTNCGAVF